MKVFWSWQSDTPGKIGRFFVRDALNRAIYELKALLDIDEPTREALHLDQDREGVAGSPELVRTILDKIDASAFVVADVTLVGQTLLPDAVTATDTKKQINSNVAIELGYAFRALTDRRVLMVFNTHYGRHEELPFDLRHRGGALVFDLAPDASRESLDSQGKLLTAKFVAALKLCLPTHRVDSAPFPETPSIASRAAYFRPGEELASVGERDVDEVKFAYAPVSLCYLRLIPTSRRDRPISLAKLVQTAPRVPLLSRQRGQGFSRPNRYGAIGFEPALFAQRTGRINASTQLFENGELWSIKRFIDHA